MPQAPEEILDLAARRALARDAGDFAAADALREQIAHAGWAVVDEPSGWRLEPSRPDAPRRVRALDVPSVLDRPVTHDATLAWVVEGWAQDVDRAIASFRSVSGPAKLQFVIADLTGVATDRWGADVEVLSLQEGTGWASAMNAALRRCRGSIVLVLDGSVEATDEMFPALQAALADPSVGVCGPFGIVTEDLHEFRRVEAPGECDAVEGYLMAFRRETLERVGGFDERFTWYRSADIEWSFRLRDAGLRVLAVPVPVEVHEHRMWEAFGPDEREERSRRNFSRFLDRWRGRWDLTVRGAPPEGG
jgi:hypothetical protein